MTTAPSLVLLFLSTGCSDNGLVPCMSNIDVGLFEPAGNDQFSEGQAITFSAMVNDPCGRDLEDATFVLSSDLQGDIITRSESVDSELQLITLESLTPGTHVFTLKAIGETGNSGSDEVVVVITDNVVPTVTFLNPPDEGASFSLKTPETIQALITDEQEDLESLVLSWTLDGLPYSGPEHPEFSGLVEFVASDLEPGCHTIEVTVTDGIGESDSDTGELIIWASEDELLEYQWWVDADGDGWGSSTDVILGCEEPSGTVMAREDGLEDCNDADAEIHPTRPDYCGDGVDSDCSPSSPSGCFPMGDVSAERYDAYITWDNPNANLSRAARQIKGVGDFNSDGYDDFVIGSNSFRSNSYITSFNSDSALFFGPITGNIEGEEDYALKMGCCDTHYNTSNEFGATIDGNFDLTGDGVEDFLIGGQDALIAPELYTFSEAYGAAFLFSGHTKEQPVSLLTLTTTSFEEEYVPEDNNGFGIWTFVGAEEESEFGAEVLLAEDMTGDGVADMVFSAPGSGDVYLVRSDDLDMLSYGSSISDSYHWKLESDEYLGTAMAASDVDGDGYSDLLLTSASDTDGTIFVVFGRDIPATAAHENLISVAGIQWKGGKGADAGADIVGLSDLDGDGDEEYAISAPGEEDGAGVVYVVPGFYAVSGMFELNEPISDVSSLNANQAVRIVGAAGDGLQALSIDGDHNSDGFNDLLIGAPGHSLVEENAGAVYIMYFGIGGLTEWWNDKGDPRSDILLTDSVQSAKDTALIYSSTEDQGFGTHVNYLGDADGNMGDDIGVSLFPDTECSFQVYFGGGY